MGSDSLSRHGNRRVGIAVGLSLLDALKARPAQIAVSQTPRRLGTRELLFFCGALAAHLALGLASRTAAWPEVTTPGYLWSRGMVLYRDVKFIHAPGLIGLLALAFRIFGPETWVLRVIALAGPLVAHAFVLSHTRRLGIPARALISAFFLVALFASDGNAVWPTVVMSALAVPLASELTRGRFLRAGLVIGAAILLKQTAAAVLLVVVVVLLSRRAFRSIVPLIAGACLPYACALAALAPAGAAREMVFWTAVVPFRVQELTPPWGPSSVAMLALAFVPTALAAALERRRPAAPIPSAPWLLAVAFGFSFLCLPTFMLMQTVAALPCLALGAARLLELLPRRESVAVSLALAAWTVSRAAIIAAGADFDGKVVFWNEDAAVNRVVARLDAYPPDRESRASYGATSSPARAGFPRGGVWVHPWLHWYFPIEDVRGAGPPGGAGAGNDLGRLSDRPAGRRARRPVLDPRDRFGRLK